MKLIRVQKQVYCDKQWLRCRESDSLSTFCWGQGTWGNKVMVKYRLAFDSQEEKNNKPKGFDDFDLKLGDTLRGERATLGKSVVEVQNELKNNRNLSNISLNLSYLMSQTMPCFTQLKFYCLLPLVVVGRRKLQKICFFSMADKFVKFEASDIV